MTIPGDTEDSTENTLLAWRTHSAGGMGLKALQQDVLPKQSTGARGTRSGPERRHCGRLVFKSSSSDQGDDEPWLLS